MGNIGKAQRQTRTLVVGLDNSGKSTIINHLKPTKEKAAEMHATVGFNVEKFKWGGMNFTMFDMSGQGRYRNLWEHYYVEAQAIVYVIDSADKVRVCVVKDELEQLLNHKDISSRKIPILFVANKMDLPKSLSTADISKLLALDKIVDRPWRIVQTNALTGAGLEDGMKWITANV